MIRLSDFSRVTSAKKFIPELDGLRFIAIISVMIYHTNNRLVALLPGFQNFIVKYFKSGFLGVEIFFAISGYILSKQILSKDNFSYSDYIKRRIRRIEPPFLISTFLLFGLWFVASRSNRQELFYSLLSVSTYTSNIFENNIINVVTWSLEIEIQFYLLLPFLLMLYKRNAKMFSGLLLILCIVGIVTFSLKWPHIKTILYYSQWFSIGLIIAIIQKRELTINTYFKGINIAIVLALFACAGQLAWFNMVVIILLLLILFNNVLVLRKGIGILKLPLVATIGGMCYTIYLFHYPIMVLFFRNVYPIIAAHVKEPLYLYSVCLGVLTLVQLLISFVLFRLFEKPFMYYEWPSKVQGFYLKFKTYSRG